MDGHWAGHFPNCSFMIRLISLDGSLQPSEDRIQPQRCDLRDSQGPSRADQHGQFCKEMNLTVLCVGVRHACTYT